MPVRLVATDLDGTLLAPDGTISPRTRAALARIQRAGIAVAVCTARPARWILELAAAGGLIGPAVCANGAVIWDLGAQRLVQQSPIAVDTCLTVVERLREVLPTAGWAIEGLDRFAHEPAYEVRWPVAGDVVVDHIEALLNGCERTGEPPVKLLLRAAAAAGADELVARARPLVGDLVELTHSSSEDTLLEMSAPGVSKGSGLAALCAAHGIARDEVIAFGDMPNDLPMLAWAGRGVAMGNAHPELLAAADQIAPANAQDGVAVVLEQLLADAGLAG